MRKILGGACTPVYVVPLSELVENGGFRRVLGGAIVPIWECDGLEPVVAPVGALLVGGGWLLVDGLDYLTVE